MIVYKMQILFIIQGLIAITGAFARTAVKELNVTNYLGHWFQVYGTTFDFTFQGYGRCITADYGLLEDGNVSVLNTQVNVNKNEMESISGYAFVEDASEPGQLSVVLDGVPVVSPYWVLSLGEVREDQYQFSIVSVPKGPSLWVLARNVDEFFQSYDQEVVDFLDVNHFNFITIDQEEC